MDYQKISILIQPRSPWVDVFIADLCDFGCDSFEETENGFNAYIPSEKLNKSLKDYLEELTNKNEFKLDFQLEEIIFKNWNEIWETSFEPILIGDWCSILAPFHEKRHKTEHTIIINPKMSFGTGHHETTLMMAEIMKNITLREKKVLDMGTGTGILAILAKKLGAKYVEAIDIDKGAFENCLENASNNLVEIIVKQGGKEKVKESDFDVILANINRNTLLNHIPFYAQKLVRGGKLLLSGFIDQDEKLIIDSAQKNQLEIFTKTQKEKWLCIAFTKK